MSKYTVAVTHATDATDVIRIARSILSPELSIADLRRRIGTNTPIFCFSTSSFPIEMDLLTSVSQLREKMVGVLSELQRGGATVLIEHHAGQTVEVVSLPMLHNLLDRELEYLAQDDD